MAKATSIKPVVKRSFGVGLPYQEVYDPAKDTSKDKPTDAVEACNLYIEEQAPTFGPGGALYRVIDTNTNKEVAQ